MKNKFTLRECLYATFYTKGIKKLSPEFKVV